MDLWHQLQSVWQAHPYICGLTLLGLLFGGALLLSLTDRSK